MYSWDMNVPVIDIGRNCQSLKTRNFESFPKTAVFEKYQVDQNISTAFDSDSYSYPKEKQFLNKSTSNTVVYCDTQSVFLAPERKKSRKEQKKLDFKSFCKYL